MASLDLLCHLMFRGFFHGIAYVDCTFKLLALRSRLPVSVKLDEPCGGLAKNLLMSSTAGATSGTRPPSIFRLQLAILREKALQALALRVQQAGRLSVAFPSIGVQED